MVVALRTRNRSSVERGRNFFKEECKIATEKSWRKGEQCASRASSEQPEHDDHGIAARWIRPRDGELRRDEARKRGANLQPAAKFPHRYVGLQSAGAVIGPPFCHLRAGGHARIESTGGARVPG